MAFDSDLCVTNACTMMLKKTFSDILFMFYAYTRIDVEVSLIKVNYWLINILSNRDIKCVNDNNGRKRW